MFVDKIGPYFINTHFVYESEKDANVINAMKEFIEKNINVSEIDYVSG